VLDAVGNEIKVGDTVMPTLWDSGRGTSLGILNVSAEVLGIGRTRILIQSDAHRPGDTDRIGPETCIVTVPADGRALRTWADKHADDRRAATASQELNRSTR
jgi:hypothetical protein